MAQGYSGIVANKVVVYQDDLDLWLGLNWVLRPPLSDLEIRAMPNMEVVLLYYTLAVVTGYSRQRPNVTTSKGLPYAFALNHDRTLQNRIYNLRPDLRYVTDAAGNRFPVLLEPSKMQAPVQDENGMLIQALSAVLSIVTFGAAWWVTAIVTIAETAASAVNDMQIAKMINGIQGDAHNVLSGIKVAKATLADPVLTAAGLAHLAAMRSQWQNYIALLQQAAPVGLARAKDMPWPSLVIGYYYQPDFQDDSLTFCSYYTSRPGQPPCGTVTSRQPKTGLPLTIVARDPAQAMARYSADWKPYTQFFYSDSVRAQVDVATIGNLPIPSSQLIGG